MSSGIVDVQDLFSFIREHKIEEVECLVPDVSGIARGKILPTEKFLGSLENRGLRIPETVYHMTVTGGYSEKTTDTSRDLYMLPDPRTARLVPWYEEPTLQIICDTEFLDGTQTHLAPRRVLQRVLSYFEERGLRPVVAPELEFFLVDVNDDPDYPLRTPIGRSGRRDNARQALGVDAVNEYSQTLEKVFNYCEDSGIDIDTLSHESGAGQIEMNFNHGDPLEMADQAFLFKRTVREAAMRHKIYATFMAKPMREEPGSALHIHQSILDIKTGRNRFSTARAGQETSLFHYYLGGLQRHMLGAMPIMAPYVNSYRRLARGVDAPINTHWGYDNRTVGFRVPLDRPEARRIENRIAGADANPYLAIAASLACGLAGLDEHRRSRKALDSHRSAWDLQHQLPMTLYEALDRMRRDKKLQALLGVDFIETYANIKESELEEFQKVISPWEREHLLLSV
ncbi:MAG: glutamine synthetase family protein [Alphaproteobacteria bacterium]